MKNENNSRLIGTLKLKLIICQRETLIHTIIASVRHKRIRKNCVFSFENECRRKYPKRFSLGANAVLPLLASEGK